MPEKPVSGDCLQEDEALIALTGAASVFIESGWTSSRISNYISQTFRQRKDNSQRDFDILKRYLEDESVSVLAEDYSLSENGIRGLADRTLKKLLKTAEVDPRQYQVLKHKGLIRASRARRNPGYWIPLLNAAQ